MKASEFDKNFEAGESIVDALDVARVCRPEEETKRIIVDFLAWMLVSLDRETRRLGVASQLNIKM